ncbi:uncharacterized protein LOC132192863 [Neocloeon triangulifer]|uniref:uncharacterized protein LOC132192863 n=1 Tax=Neocloeon triangulifer TaxID=2078957 RepID=UPI00286EE6B0|nr:uncharacterized protein LOC132192863 [Neocloeon triangulifer]XP_059469030.1 uncharacterized protein LOC132192863 [Neocloeon triangulifer]
MDVDLETLSQEELLRLAEKVQKMRYAAAKPKSLKILTMKSIVSNWEFYHNLSSEKSVNLLDLYMPNSIVQDFFDKGNRLELYPVGENNSYPNPQICFEFVLLLLNKNTTEFDFYKNMEIHSYREERMIYYHIVKNCPNITKIVLSNTVYAMSKMKICTEELLKWRNLKYCGFLNFICNEWQLKTIQEKIPQLEGLEIAVSNRSFSEKAAEHFSNMQNLKHLSICPARRRGQYIAMEVMANCVGQTPNLQTFLLLDESNGEGKMGYNFLRLYKKFYPNKSLTLKNLKIWMPFEEDWPSNVTVRELTISKAHHTNELSVKNLSAMPCPPAKLTITEEITTLVYPLLKKFGPQISELKFQDCIEPINLFTVIQCCPNLEVLSCYCTKNNMFERIELPLENFKKWKRFAIRQINGRADGVLSEADTIFKMFLLGSENIDKQYLHLRTYGQIKILADFLKEYPKSHFQTLKKVKINVEDELTIEPALEVAKGLIFHSLQLQKIELWSSIYSTIFYTNSEIIRETRKRLENLRELFKIDISWDHSNHATTEWESNHWDVMHTISQEGRRYILETDEDEESSDDQESTTSSSEEDTCEGYNYWVPRKRLKFL